MSRNVIDKITFWTLDEEAENEVYILIDKHLRPLPKNSDGTINKDAKGFQHNEIDALRHAYVSGVFTMEYHEKFAAFLGTLVEYNPFAFIGSSQNLEKSRNMDLWNNSIGRKYGKQSKTREELFHKLLQALKNKELITHLKDTRKYSINDKPMIESITKPVAVLKESETGENLLFLDTNTLLVFSKDEFVAKIKNGEYGDHYEIRTVEGKEIATSKRDGVNNLG